MIRSHGVSYRGHFMSARKGGIEGGVKPEVTPGNPVGLSCFRVEQFFQLFQGGFV